MKKNKYILLVLLIALKSAITFGQTDSLKRCECKTDTIKTFGHPERMATFPSGFNKLLEFLEENLQYPEKATEQKIEDRVFLSLCILETGEISDISVARGKYQILNEEAIRVVKLMPNWEPAFNNGKTICSNFILPVTFKLESINKLNKNKKRHKST